MERIRKSLGSFIRVFQMMRNRSEEAGLKTLSMDPQYLMLSVLQERSLPMTELSHRLQRSKPNMTALVAGLIRAGLARRLPDKKDRRVIRIEISEKGMKVMEERRRIAKEAIRQNLADLSESDLDGLCESLENVNRIIAKLNRD